MGNKTLLKKDRGVAGLNVLLSVIVMLFITGFLIMVFTILGAQIQDETYTAISGTTHNETLTTVVEGGEILDTNKYNYPSCSITGVTNASGGEAISSGNYTTSSSGCIIYSAGGEYNNSDWNVSYTWTAEQNNTASGVIFDTSDELSNTTDWFGIIIVITAMVVLILLTVIIISAIKGGGIISGGSSTPRFSA